MSSLCRLHGITMKLTKDHIRQRLARFDSPEYGFASFGKHFPDSKKAAVLVPLLVRNDDVHVLLTLRSSHLRTHSGDVAFPGGKKDDCDSDEIVTCLRESDEEIGLKQDQVEIVSHMPGYVSRHNVYISPVIGFIPEYFQGVANEEVETIFSLPLRRFLSNKGHQSFDFTTEAYKGKIHKFHDEINGKVVATWGLTASMCVGLAVAVYGRFPAFKFAHGELDVNDPFKHQRMYLEGFLERHSNELKHKL